MVITRILAILLFVGCLSMAVFKTSENADVVESFGWAGLGIGFGILAVSTAFPEFEFGFSVLFLVLMIVSVSLLYRGFRSGIRE